MDTSARCPHDQFAVQKNVAGKHVGMLDSFEHGGHGCMADLATRLMNTSKRYGAVQVSSAAANGAAMSSPSSNIWTGALLTLPLPH